MGCCEGCGTVILVLINFLFSLIGVVLLVVSCLVRFGTDAVDTYLQDAYDAFQTALKDAGADADISDLDIGDVIGDASLAFIVIGAFFFILGICGCIGASCKIKCLLVTYAVVLIVIFIAEVVFVVLLFTIKSTLDGWISNPLVDTLEQSYTGTNGTDAFTLTINFVMHRFECCGIKSYKEFQNATKWKSSVGKTLEVPAICCTNGTICTTNPTKDNSYINTGCYDAVNEWLTDNSSILIGVGAGVAGIQLILIIFSMVICCQERKDDYYKDYNDDDIPIQPYRESRDQFGQHNPTYTEEHKYGPRSPTAQYNDRIRPEPYQGRTDQYTGPPDGYGYKDPYRR
ncbi:Tetraspanin 1 [Mactra antiquata]